MIREFTLKIIKVDEIFCTILFSNNDLILSNYSYHFVTIDIESLSKMNFVCNFSFAFS